MKNKMVRAMAMTMASVMLLAGCGGNADNKEDSKAENTNQQVAEEGTETTGGSKEGLSMWTWLGTEELMKMSTGDIMAVQEISNRTGVATEWINPSDSTTEFQMLMTSGENMPDCIYYKYVPQDVLKYSANGNIIDLSGYIDQYMPNFKGIIEENKRLKAQITSEDGAIYYFPWITEEKYFYEGLMLRKDWLDATGLSIPTNNEELYGVLKAQKELFDKGELPNAGEKYYGLGGYPTQLIKLAYGFDTTNDFMIQNDEIVFGPATDEFREAMKWFHKLYSEGLIDPDVLSMDRDLYMQHHNNNMTAGFVDGYGAFQEVELTTENIEYVPVGYMANEAGKVNEYNTTAKRIAQPYGWAVSKDGEANIEDICKLFDYSYSNEGQVLMSWGIEGDTFETVNEEKVYSDKIMKDPEYVPNTAMAKYVKPDFGRTDIKTNMALLDERGIETFKLWEKTDVTNAMEPFLWTTDEESDLIGQIVTDLKTGAEEGKERFMTGAADPSDDAVWSDYQKTLEGLRVEEVCKVYNDAYQRFAPRIK